MANVYDRIFKENFVDCTIGLLRKVTGARKISSYPLNEKMQHTLEPEGDRFFLIDPTGKKKDRYIVHIEWQTSNSSKMSGRMLLYHALRFLVNGLPVRGFVIYAGKKPLTMKNKVEHFSLKYSYEIINLQDWSPQVFLRSKLPAELIMAILAGKTKGEEKREIIQKVLTKLQELLNEDPMELRRRLVQMKTLGGLRDICSIILEEENNMATLLELVGPPSAKDDILYRYGVEQTKIAMVKTLLSETDFPNKKIAHLVGVTVSSVLKIKKSLPQA